MDQGRKRRWLHAPSPAMIVACIALFIALGGTSYAAIVLPAGSVGTKQLKKSAVTGVKVKNATLTGAKIKNASLTGADIVAASLGKVPSAVSADSVVDGAVGPSKLGAIPGARVRRTTAVTVTGNASGSTVLSYDATPDFSVGGVYDGTKPTRMTASIAGTYLIVANARWQPDPAGRRTLALVVNGTGAQFARSNVSAFLQGGAGFSPEQTVQAVYKLNAGDYVEVWAFQDSGGPLTLQTNVDNAVTFAMEWLAP